MEKPSPDTPEPVSPSLDFAAVFRANPSPCLLVDRNLNITSVNDAYLRATLTSREQLLGRHIFDAFPDNPAHPQAKSTANLAASFERVLRRREPDVMAIQRYDIRVGEAQQFEERFWSPVNTPVLDQAGDVSHILHRVEDVTRFVQEQSRIVAIELRNDEQATEIRLANARLREANTALERERQMRELFIVTVTHDLRTPLAAAKLAAQMLPRKSDDPARILGLSERLTASLDRCESMISDLLDASQLRSGEKLRIEIEPLELADIATETLAELSSLHGDRFVLDAPEPVEGRWSRLELRRMLENLCINGVKYGAAEQPVRVTVARRASQVEVRVHNWGTPIPEHECMKLFEPYQRSGASQGGAKRGWGLGLTIVAGIAEAHGGTVAVDSSTERGTTFKVTLPLQPPP